MIPTANGALEEYLRLRGHHFSQQSGWLVTHCPIHNERTGSFKIKIEDGHAWCFGSCDRAYDVIDMIHLLEYPHDGMGKAISVARKKGYLTGEFDRSTPSSDIVTIKSRLPTTLEITGMTALWEITHELLEDAQLGKKPRAWLTGHGQFQRGLRGPGFADAIFSLGYAPWDPALFKRICRHVRSAVGEDWAEVGEAIGLLTKADETGQRKQRLSNRMLFFALDGNGRATYYQGRTLNDGGKANKFLNPPKLRKVPYVPLNSRDAIYPGTYITEGPLDALAFAACGFHALALMGSSIPAVSVLQGFPAPIVGFLDNDEAREDGTIAAGPKNTAVLARRCREHGIAYCAGTIPEGVKDASAWLKARDPKAFIAENERQLACLDLDAV